MSKQRNLRRLNFWKLLWNRYTKYSSFYEMFDQMALEEEEKRSVVWTIIRTCLKISIFFLVIGGIVWWLHIFYPKDVTITKIIGIGTPIVLTALIVIAIFSYKMVKAFNAFRRQMNKLTSGGGIYDGIDIIGGWND